MHKIIRAVQMPHLETRKTSKYNSYNNFYVSVRVRLARCVTAVRQLQLNENANPKTKYCTRAALRFNHTKRGQNQYLYRTSYYPTSSSKS